MKVAIIGAGFSGVASAWHLLNKDSAKVTLFDLNGIGGGASGVAAGLMHPYVGAHSKLNWRGMEGYHATTLLLKIASESLSQPVANDAGLLRVALTEQQAKNFLLCSQKYRDVEWLTPDECLAVMPGTRAKGGIKIRTAVAVNCQLYLQGLWQACQKKGAVLKHQAIANLQELKDFDAIIVANGPACTSFSELSHLRITPVKGQILELSWPMDISMPILPMSSQAYIILNPSAGTCFAGATYERNFTDSGLDCEFAKKELMPKVESLIPILKNAEVIGCRAGVRVSTPNHLPIVQHVGKNIWVITGMGSKGLLYHSLFAEQVACEVLSMPL